MPGLGEIGAKYYLLGEAPGRTEDEQNMPFVGAAGKKLDRLLELAKIDPNEIYLANVCRCRPPENRTPKKKEIAACKGFVFRELRLVKPSFLITLGSTPLSLFSPYGVTQVHGTSFIWEMPDEP